MLEHFRNCKWYNPHSHTVMTFSEVQLALKVALKGIKLPQTKGEMLALEEVVFNVLVPYTTNHRFCPCCGGLIETLSRTKVNGKTKLLEGCKDCNYKGIVL